MPHFVQPQTDGVADHRSPAEVAVDPTVIEPKVRAATAAASAAAGVLLPFVLWLLAVYVFDGPVPWQVEGAVGLVVTGASTFAAGYFARHVDRVQIDG